VAQVQADNVAVLLRHNDAIRAGLLRTWFQVNTKHTGIWITAAHHLYNALRVVVDLLQLKQRRADLLHTLSSNRPKT
jgi:hypothetical protein